MLKKLLKYDLKYMLKSISVFYILALLFAVLSRLLTLPKQTIIITVLLGITKGCLYSMLASTLINTLMRSWVRFRDSLFKDESYLTHTLPVSKNSIYQSKFLLSLIYTIIGFVVIILSLLIAFYTKDNWTSLTNLIKGISKGFNVSTTFFVASLVSIIFLEMFNILVSGFLGMIIGYSKENNKLPLSIMFGFIIYVISEMFVLLVMFIAGLFNNDIAVIFTSTSVLNMDVLKTITILGISVYTASILIINLVSVKLLKKGVNIE